MKTAANSWTTFLDHIAYLLVHSFASWLYRARSVLYILAISGTNGSSGFGSVSIEQIESNTANIYTSNSEKRQAYLITVKLIRTDPVITDTHLIQTSGPGRVSINGNVG